MNNNMIGSMTQQESFLQAHALYNAKEYEQALDLYKTITDKGCATWYNMGNSAFRLGRYTEARVYWNRALHDATKVQRADIVHNIQVLNKKQGIQLVENNRYLDRGVQQIQAFPIVYLQTFFLVGWIGLWACMKRWHTKERYLIFVLLACLNGLAGVAIVYRFVQMQRQTGIITAHIATMHAGPSERYHAIGTIPEITACEIQEICGEWCKVRSGALRGWIKKECCELI